MTEVAWALASIVLADSDRDWRINGTGDTSRCRAEGGMIGVMTDPYPYNGRLSRWEEIAEGLAIVGVQPLEAPFPFQPGQYATLGLTGPRAS